MSVFFRFKKYRYLKNRYFWGDHNIYVLTLKTGLFAMFFLTEKRYRIINKVSINSNTNNIVPLRVCSISELRCLTRKFATRWRVTTVQSLSSPSQIYLLISVPKWIQNLLTIPNSRFLLSLRPFLLLLALLVGSTFRSLP